MCLVCLKGRMCFFGRLTLEILRGTLRSRDKATYDTVTAGAPCAVCECCNVLLT